MAKKEIDLIQIHSNAYGVMNSMIVKAESGKDLRTCRKTLKHCKQKNRLFPREYEVLTDAISRKHSRLIWG